MPALPLNAAVPALSSEAALPALPLEAAVPALRSEAALPSQAAPPPRAGAAGEPRPVPGLLAAAEQHLRIGSPAALADAVTRSYLDDGRCVGWYGPPASGWRLAIDAERADAPVPPALARRFGATDFWARWTRAECCCKLADVPVVAWWRRYGLGTPSDGAAIWRTLRLADLVVTVGFAPTHPPRDLALTDSESRLTRLSPGQ